MTSATWTYRWHIDHWIATNRVTGEQRKIRNDAH